MPERSEFETYGWATGDEVVSPPMKEVTATRSEEAEARGYRKAITALRDQTAWTDYMLSRTDEDLYEHENLFAADFLEAIAEEGK